MAPVSVVSGYYFLLETWKMEGRENGRLKPETPETNGVGDTSVGITVGGFGYVGSVGVGWVSMAFGAESSLTGTTSAAVPASHRLAAVSSWNVLAHLGSIDQALQPVSPVP